MGLRQEIPQRLSEQKFEATLTAHELALWGVNYYRRKAYIRTRKDRLRLYAVAQIDRKGRHRDKVRHKGNGLIRQLPF